MPLPSPEQFVVAWQISGSIKEVSTRLKQAGFKMSHKRTKRWGRTLSEMGVQLKQLTRHNHLADSAALYY